MSRFCFIFTTRSLSVFLAAFALADLDTPARDAHDTENVVETESRVTEGTAWLEEIVVMAQKREQRLQDVGIAVTAFSGEQIEQLGIVNSTDVAAMTPGLNYTVPNGESSQINFFLRGVGLNDFADANENPVAVYVDEVYRPAMGGLSFQLSTWIAWRCCGGRKALCSGATPPAVWCTTSPEGPPRSWPAIWMWPGVHSMS